MGYICDPNKNTRCKKTMCHINGGACHYTTDPRYAKDWAVPVKSTKKKLEYLKRYYQEVTKPKRKEKRDEQNDG